MKASKPRWLQRQLTRRLMFPVLALVALTVFLGAYGAQRLVDRVFDRWLLDTARSLADQVEVVNGQPVVELSRQAEALLTYDIVDQTHFEVVQGSKHLLGQRGIPVHGDREGRYSFGGRAYDAHFDGEDVRVAWVPVTGAGKEGVAVMAAETLTKRRFARHDLMVTMAPIGILVLIAALVIGLTVQRTIRPLERIAARWNERSHASLDSIPIDDVPRELLPFATALNDLLGRVRAMLDRERRFAATVAHQLRTPLAGLRLGLARAASEPDVSSMRGVLADLGTTTQRTARLVQQLLALGRLDAEGRTALELVDIDLTALVRDVGESYMDSALEKRIELELASSATVVLVSGQPNLLSEAFGNLIENAIHYTPAGGRILISVDAASRSVSVDDSGPGVAVEEQQAVFERFVRGRDSVGEGSGLGLSISKEIAVLHGAELTLSSSSLGGACLTMRFA